MFKVCKSLERVSEVSYHELRNLKARVSNPSSANILRAFLLPAAIDSVKLQSALHFLALRHEALRTRFVKDVAGNYSREVVATADVHVVKKDFSGFSHDDESVKEYLKHVVMKGFGPQDYPLISVHLLTTSKKPLIIFLIAEVIADAISVAILLRELSGLYVNRLEYASSKLAPLDYQLSDFVASHNAWMRSQAYRDSLGRLRDKLHHRIETEDGASQLIFSRQSNSGYAFDKAFTSALNEKVFKLANALKVSPPTVLMIASAISVARLRNLRGIFFTSSFSNRHISGLANLVGHPATTVPNYLSLCAEETSVLNVKKMHRELFASMAQFGMIPIQEISNEVALLYPNRPTGTTIKFGRVVTDVSMVDEFPMLGMQAELYPSENVRAETNEFKFVYRVLSSGIIRLCLRGLQETDNKAVALKIIDYKLEETLDLLSSS